MQRRAAAAYAALFVLVAVGAYVTIGFAQNPGVSIENPDYSLGDGEEFDVNGRTYAVKKTTGSPDPAGRSATLVWTNTSERRTMTLANNSEIPAVNATWPNQTARMEATFANGSTIQYSDSQYTVLVDDGSFTLRERNVSFSVGDTFPYQGNQTNVTAARNGNVTLAWNVSQSKTLTDGSTVSYNGSEYTLRVGTGQFNLTSDRTASFGVGDDFPYRDNETIVTAAGNGSVTIAWGAFYNVTTQVASNDSFTFRETFNVTAVLMDDPAVNDSTATIGGTEYVRYTNGTTQPLTEYLPEPEVKNFSEGASFELDTPGNGVGYNTVTVVNVSAERALLEWRGPVDHEVTASHAENVTLGPDERLFVAHFPENGTLELSADVGAYQEQLAVQDTYHKRVNGLWGVAILSGLSAVFLIGAAYLPSRY